MSDETKVSVLCSLFNWMQKSKTSAKKRSKFRKYLDSFCNSKDYFSSIRLIIPNLDRERGSYGLKESVLATCLIDALGMSRDSEDAVRLINWRKGGPKTGTNVGNFALVAAEVLQRRQGMISGELTIKELNEFLDRLASSENRAEKTSILSTLITKTNAQEMKWIVMIILKDLKLGISEKSIFHEFHPDAEDLFNVTCDLKLVCEKLSNRNQRHKRQDIEVGKPVRPQLAMRVGNANAAWKRLVGKEVVVECKFDGDRIQIHKNGSDIHFFSRNFLDHPEYEHAMSKIIIENIKVDKCILDGEMLVWDFSLNRFAEFGSNQEIAKERLDSDRQLCYVAFDVLYVGDTSVIHQTLKERHELVRKVVNPLKGRLEILVPNNGLNTHRPSGEPCWSRIAQNVEDIETFFKNTVENRDEGIVLKDLGSTWEPSDRSGKWLKLKPDYIHPGSDLDVLIIGGYYGSGRRGGEVAQFLVGLAERSSPGTYPRKFISFCRVGTGLSDDQLDAVVTKLKPFFKKNEYPKKSPPSYYQVTNNSKERPDVWIDSPEKSIILSITSDIRTIRSDTFAAPYGLRFPRIDQVRFDKPWFDCLDVQSFIELVHSSNGTTHRGTDNEGPSNNKPKNKKLSKKGEKKSVSAVPSQFLQTDVSTIKEETLIFSKMMFYFINVPSTHSLDALHKLVAQNGGTFSMNLNNSVTHCVASESKGIKYQAAKLRSDIIHCSWVLDSCREKKLQPLHPKYFLYLSDSSKKKLQEDIDDFSDSYYQNLDLAVLKNLLSNINRSEDSQTMDYFKKKYCPDVKWGRFHNCCIFFSLYMQPINADWNVVLKLALRRMKLEVSMGGGKISNDLSRATHLVILSVPDFDVNFDDIIKSFPTADKHLLCYKRLHVVRSKWFEDCLEKEQKLQEDTYSIRPKSLEISNIEECNHGIDIENYKNSSSSKIKEKLTTGKEALLQKQASPERDNKRKRGRPAATKQGKTRLAKAPRTRARIGKNAAKIYEDKSESDSNASSEEEKNKEYVIEIPEIHKCEIKEDPKGKAKQLDVGEDSESSKLDSRDHGIENWKGSEKCERLEVMIDPVQAMLLDMIPCLGIKKQEITNPVIETEKQSVVVDHPIEEPVKKKKKVSYKDMASELLKDW